MSELVVSTGTSPSVIAATSWPSTASTSESPRRDYAFLGLNGAGKSTTIRMLGNNCA